MTDMTDYDALKAALDAFKAILVDPSALAAAIAANKDVTSLVAIGENPGFWAPNNQAGILASTIQEATAYLKSGKYTQAEVDAYVEAITSGAADIFALANPVEEGKWYAFKFDSIENYEARGWNKADPANATLGDLFDNYAAPADVVTEGEGDEQSSRLQGFSSLEDIAVGQNVRFINEDVIEQMDQIAFRFIAQGDSAYVIQHKSGLYLNGASRSTNLSLGLSPALFNVKAVGYGKVVIEVRNLKGQGYYTAPVYLHAQNAGHSLVTWSDAAVSSKSALFIEPVSDFDEGDDVAESVLFNTKPNSIQFVCFPAAFSVGISPDSGAKLVFITLPNVFQQAFSGAPLIGELVALLFYSLLSLAALTSLMSLHEVSTAFFHEELKISRKWGAGIVTVLCALIGVFCSLSYGDTREWLVFGGQSLFGWFDFLTGQIFLPTGGLLTCLFLGWYVPKHIVKEEFTNEGTLRGRFFGIYLFAVRYVCPICILLIFLHQFGVI